MAIQNKPKLDIDEQRLWDIFTALQGHRIVGAFSEGPILYTEIEAWFRLHRIQPHARRLEILWYVRHLDSTLAELKKKEADRKGKR